MEQRTKEVNVEERVRRNVDRLQSLPALSSVVSKVISLADNPTVSGQQVAEVVGNDQSMVTAILKIVNSPFYGLNRRVSSINHAVILLGYRTVRNIALSTSLVNAFSGSTRDERFDRARFWAHSVFTASAARLVGRKLRQTDAEEAFLAGLIHDMGRIVFDHYFSKEFSVALDLVAARGLSLHEAEKIVLGLDHAELGKLIAQKWNFPPQVCEAIGVHHDPEAALDTGELAVCVYLADVLSHAAEGMRRAFEFEIEVEGEGNGDGDAEDETGTEEKRIHRDEDDVLELIDLRVREHLGLDAQRVGELLADMEAEMEKAQAFLSALNVG